MLLALLSTCSELHCDAADRDAAILMAASKLLFPALGSHSAKGQAGLVVSVWSLGVACAPTHWACWECRSFRLAYAASEDSLASRLNSSFLKKKTFTIKSILIILVAPVCVMIKSVFNKYQ